MPIRVLLAEDEWIIAAATRSQVESHGYEVVGVVGTGTAAVEACGRERPDVVFMDLQMPVMDGLTATRKVMSGCACPVVVVTGHAEEREAAEAAGAMEFVLKPVLTGEIPALIARARARFERFQIVHRDYATCQETVAAWVVVQQAVRAGVAEEGLSEAEAFRRLQQTADARGVRLVEAAREVHPT